MRSVGEIKRMICDAVAARWPEIDARPSKIRVAKYGGWTNMVEAPDGAKIGDSLDLRSGVTIPANGTFVFDMYLYFRPTRQYGETYDGDLSHNAYVAVIGGELYALVSRRDQADTLIKELRSL